MNLVLMEVIVYMMKKKQRLRKISFMEFSYIYFWLKWAPASDICIFTSSLGVRGQATTIN